MATGSGGIMLPGGKGTSMAG